MRGTLKTNLLTATYSILLFFLLMHTAKIFSAFRTLLAVLTPFFTGFAFAYLLDGIYTLFRERILSSMRKKRFTAKLHKPFSLILTYLIVLVAAGLFLYLIFPQIIRSADTLVKNIPSYLDAYQNMTGRFYAYFQENTALLAQLEKWTVKLSEVLSTLISSSLPQILGMTKALASALFNLLLGLVISAYLLSGKERLKLQVKKFFYALLPEKIFHKTECMVQLADCIFGSFIRGQLIDSFLVGCLTFVCMWIFRFPYPLLIAAVIGITNLIPIFGPFIGAVPSFFIVLMVSPVKALWFILLIFIIQQLEGNFLAPKIMGDSVGLSGLWVMFAIIVGGGLFGIIGILIGIPVFAVIYKLVSMALYQRLEQKSLYKDL